MGAVLGSDGRRGDRAGAAPWRSMASSDDCIGRHKSLATGDFRVWFPGHIRRQSAPAGAKGAPLVSSAAAMAHAKPIYDLTLLLDLAADDETRAKIIADTRSAIESEGELLAEQYEVRRCRVGRCRVRRAGSAGSGVRGRDRAAPRRSG